MLVHAQVPMLSTITSANASGGGPTEAHWPCRRQQYRQLQQQQHECHSGHIMMKDADHDTLPQPSFHDEEQRVPVLRPRNPQRQKGYL
jgi:hypothetical protein